MDLLLSDPEIRVLGCLLEKEMTTPDYYPLSLNALINACNQKSNRYPTVSYDEHTVVTALHGLFERNLARQSNISRVPKYEHIFSEKFNLIPSETAIVCILLLRGPQTAGEIRGRTERLFAFHDLAEVAKAIRSLEDIGLVTTLPRQPGRKESRHTHLLRETGKEIPEQRAPLSETVRPGLPEKDEDIAQLREQLHQLRQELQQLRTDFETFTSQFN